MPEPRVEVPRPEIKRAPIKPRRKLRFPRLRRSEDDERDLHDHGDHDREEAAREELRRERSRREMSDEDGEGTVSLFEYDWANTTYNNEKISQLLRHYQERKARNLRIGLDEYQQLRSDVISALNDPDLYTGDGADARKTADMQAAEPLLAEISNKMNDVIEQSPSRHQREDFIKGLQIMDRDRHVMRVANEDDVFADAGVRDEVFAGLFSSVDGVPHVFFQQAFDPLTDGMIYKTFMDSVRDKAYHPELIPEEAVEKYKVINGIDVENDRDYAGRTPDEVDGILRGKIALELKDDYTRYSKERQLREIVHNANALLELPSVQAEQIYEYINQKGAQLLDYANRISGVKEMKDIYEEVLREIMYENDGYLPPDLVQARPTTVERSTGVAGVKMIPAEAEERARMKFADRVKKGLITLHINDVQGKVISKTDFKEWEVDRIFNTARGELLMDLRLLSLASESRLPKEGRYSSLYMQDAIQNYDPNAHLISKYAVPSYYTLASMLTSPDREKIMGLVRKPWMPKRVVDLVHMLKEGLDPQQILDGEFGEQLQIRRQSVGLCGDAWSFMGGYRMNEKVSAVSASKDFLARGIQRMKMLTGQVGVDENVPEGQDYLLYSPTERVRALWESLDEEGRKSYLNEYANWQGTGFRFERLRDDIRQKDTSAIEKGKEILSRIVELQPGRIFLKSRKIQQRLKERTEMVNDKTTMQNVFDNLHFLEQEMYTMREELLREGYTFDGKLEESVGGQRFTLHTIREKLQHKRRALEQTPLAEGETPAMRASKLAVFDMPHEETWAQTEEFMHLMQEDFNQYKDHKGQWYDHADEHGHSHKKFDTNQEGYYQEFMYNRDYNHGFILWSGDAPTDEFNYTSAGATAALIRRARENKDVGAGAIAYIEFMAGMNHYKTPQEVAEAIVKVYDQVKSYDADKAKEVVTYMTEAAVKFYAATGAANIPIIGELLIKNNLLAKGTDFMGKHLPGRVGHFFAGVGDNLTGSLSTRLYDNKAGTVWHATHIRKLINDTLYVQGKLSKAQRDALLSHVSARQVDVWADKGSVMMPILTIAILIYLMKKASDDM